MRWLQLVVGAWLAVPVTPVRALTVLQTSMQVEEHGVYRFEATAIADVRPLAMRHVMVNLCAFRNQIPNMAFCRVFKVEGPTIWTYSIVQTPFLDPRDYSVLSVLERDLKDDHTGEYFSQWKIDAAGGPRPQPGHVRLQINDGSLLMRPRDNGTRTELQYVLRLAPGGFVPAWIAGVAAKRTWPDSFRSIEHVAQLEDRRGTVLLPVAGQPWAACEVRPLESHELAPQPAFPAAD